MRNTLCSVKTGDFRLSRQLYQTNEFAKKSSVSVRTLQFYDKKGLLSPSEYTKAGYRLYSDDDLIRLQVLAEKAHGFIRVMNRCFWLLQLNI